MSSVEKEPVVSIWNCKQLQLNQWDHLHNVLVIILIVHSLKQEAE